MKSSFVLHHNYYWTIKIIFFLVLLVRQIDAVSYSTANRRQQVRYSDNDSCSALLASCNLHHAVGTAAEYIKHFRMKKTPYYFVNRSIVLRVQLQHQHFGKSLSSQHILSVRGGGLFDDGGNKTDDHSSSVPKNNDDKIIVHNPSYQQLTSAVVTLGDIESSYSARMYDEGASHKQQNYGPKRRPIVATSSRFNSMQQYTTQWYIQYPILAQITLSCVLVFLAWHIPLGTSIPRIMNQYFVCHRSHLTLRSGKFLSLLLSAISHIDIWHLLYNVMALVSLGPSVQSILDRKQTTSTTRIPVLGKYQQLSLSSNEYMWLLVIGAAMSGSITYLLWNEIRGIGSSAGGCLGLSAVTMSFLSLYASAYPHRILQFRIGGIIPIRLPAEQLLLVAVFGSMVGCILPMLFKSRRNDSISHSGHLGGLIFGLAFYDMIILNRPPLNTFYNSLQRMVTQK